MCRAPPTAETLGPWDYHQSQADKQIDAKPKAPSAKHALFRYRHDQPSLTLDVSADRDGVHGVLEPHDDRHVVIYERMCAV